MSNIYWSADTHIGHQCILKFMPNRPYASEENIQAHDEWIINLWQTSVGNHDGAIKAHSNYFRKIAQVMEITIKPSMYEVLSEELQIVLCHYSLLDWPDKQQGSVMLHGHCHVTMDDFNASSADLRFDIGIDEILAKQAGGFIDIKTLYEAILKKTGGLTPQQYANEKY